MIWGVWRSQISWAQRPKFSNTQGSGSIAIKGTKTHSEENLADEQQSACTCPIHLIHLRRDPNPSFARADRHKTDRRVWGIDFALHHRNRNTIMIGINSDYRDLKEEIPTGSFLTRLCFCFGFLHFFYFDLYSFCLCALFWSIRGVVVVEESLLLLFYLLLLWHILPEAPVELLFCYEDWLGNCNCWNEYFLSWFMFHLQVY